MSKQSTESLKFPSGRTVRQVRKDAKKLKNLKGMKHSEALNLLSRKNGINADWNNALQKITQGATPISIPTATLITREERLRRFELSTCPDIKTLPPSLFKPRNQELAQKTLLAIIKTGMTDISENGQHKVVRFSLCEVVKELKISDGGMARLRIRQNLAMLMAKPESPLVSLKYERKDFKETWILEHKS